MLTVSEAIDLLDARMAARNDPTPVLRPLGAAVGAVPVEDVLAPESVPRFDNAAMDGFLVRRERIEPGVWYPVAGAVFAGPLSVRPEWADASVLKITTGAPIVDGFDAVIMKEDVESRGQEVRFRARPKAAQHIRRAAEDVQAGSVAVSAGTTIGPGLASFLASTGVDEVWVRPAPRVTVVSTGSELVTSRAALGPGMILESNGLMLRSLLREEGVETVKLELVQDDPAAVRETLVAALDDSDLLIVVGGMSVGEKDHVKAVLEDAGVERWFWKVAQKPGKPIMLGATEACVVAGLPGNPYSAYVGFAFYVRRVLRHWFGAAELALPTLLVPVSEDVTNPGDRTVFRRACFTNAAGGLCASPLSGIGSHLMSAFTKTDGLLALPPRTTYRAGEAVVLHLLRGPG